MSESYKAEIKTMHQGLASVLLPKSQNIHTHIKDFLQQEVKDFEKINRENDNVLDQLKEEWEQYNRLLTEIKTKKNKDSKFIEGSAGYIKAKEDQITAKKKVLQSVNTGLKESVTKIKPQKLAILPYEKNTILKEVFRTLFQVLYNQPASKYNWETFKKLALLHNNGEDFITRMANIDFKDLPESYHVELLKLKNDEQFKDACENSSYAYDVVDIADWVDYVCEGQKISAQKKQSQHDLNKIRLDKIKREDKSVELKEQFCNQTLKDIDLYQNNLMSLQSEIRTLTFNMNSSVNDIKQIEEKRRQQIQKINDI